MPLTLADRERTEELGRMARQELRRRGKEPFFWRPLPGPQTVAFETPAFETLYGGAAGGGKSDLLLGLPRSSHRSSVLFRRTYVQLEDTLIHRSLEIFGDPGNYNRARHVWSFPDGSRISFRYLDQDNDVYKYQSTQFDFIGFDELTQFTRLQYEYLFSRCRTPRRAQRCRVVGCTNPGGEGNDWVMDRWAPWLREDYPRPARPGELRWFKRVGDGREAEAAPGDPEAISRTFIPARLSDNPYLSEDYRRTLASLPEPFRSQLLNGDWKAGLQDDALQVIPTAWIRASMDRWRDDPPRRAGPVCLGVDVARGGEDQTVMAPRYGPWIAPLRKFRGAQTPDGQTVAALLAEELAGQGVACVDVVGIGASAYDASRMKGLAVRPVNFAERSAATDRSGTLRFVNLRAEAYWRLREALDPRGPQPLDLPPDPELLGDLRSPRWSMQTNGVKIEDKEEIRRRLGRSPDCGDAVALACLGPAFNPQIRVIES